MSSENTQFFLAGDIYLDIFDANYQPTGLIGPMNGELLSMQPNSERIDQLSKMRDSYGQVRNSVLVPQPAELKLTLRDVPTQVFAAAFMGGVSTLSEGADSVTDEAVTARLGRWVDLPNRNLDANSVVVTDSTGGTTYVEGTDYEINYRLGMIRALSGGAISDGDSVLVDYTSSAVSGDRVETMTVSQMKARIVVDGVNMADDNRQIHAEIYRATLAPDQAFDLMAEQHAVVSFTGTMETPAGMNSPADDARQIPGGREPDGGGDQHHHKEQAAGDAEENPQRAGPDEQPGRRRHHRPERQFPQLSIEFIHDGKGPQNPDHRRQRRCQKRAQEYQKSRR